MKTASRACDHKPFKYVLHRMMRTDPIIAAPRAISTWSTLQLEIPPHSSVSPCKLSHLVKNLPRTPRRADIE
eukprot:scaffold227277_cov37-Tisochrysis_lutea.AAC.1